ncbi:MAG: hypothetical protein GXY15_00325 [Candidatus Hydrogenedentes bacterium]|nr:hypothetical protein [Candidatus Hydrogenedentota bacterium]
MDRQRRRPAWGTGRSWAAFGLLFAAVICVLILRPGTSAPTQIESATVLDALQEMDSRKPPSSQANPETDVAVVVPDPALHRPNAAPFETAEYPENTWVMPEEGAVSQPPEDNSAETPDTLIRALQKEPLPPSYDKLIGSSFPTPEFSFLRILKDNQSYQALLEYGCQCSAAERKELCERVLRELEEWHDHFVSQGVPPAETVFPGFALSLPLLVGEWDDTGRALSRFIPMIDEDRQRIAFLLPEESVSGTHIVPSYMHQFMVQAMDEFLWGVLQERGDEAFPFSNSQWHALSRYADLKGHVGALEGDLEEYVEALGIVPGEAPPAFSEMEGFRLILNDVAQWVPTEEFPEFSHEESVLAIFREFVSEGRPIGQDENTGAE